MERIRRAGKKLSIRYDPNVALKMTYFRISFSLADVLLKIKRALGVYINICYKIIINKIPPR